MKHGVRRTSRSFRLIPRLADRRGIRGALLGTVVVMIAAGLAACTVPAPSSHSNGNATTGTLNILEWTNAGAVDATNAIDDAFEKAHPGVHIKLQTAPTSTSAWATLTNSALAAKSVDVLAAFAPTRAAFPPSYTGLPTSSTASLVTSNQLVDMSKQPFFKRYNAADQKLAIGYKSGTYGVMAAEYAHNGGLWYKKSLLDKYGMKVPTTFDEFLSDLKTFKAHGLSPLFLAGKDNIQKTLWDGLAEQLIMKGHPSDQSGQVGDDRAKAFWTGKQSWNDAVYHQVAKEYEEVMKYIEPAAAGAAEYTAPGTWSANANDYPFLLDGSFDYATVKLANPSLKVGFFTLPGTNESAANRMLVSPDLTWTVPVWAPHRKLALEWLSMFSQPKYYKMWLAQTGSVSTQPGVTSQANASWQGWLNSHASNSMPDLITPFTEPGSATDAIGPDLTTVKPIGSQDPDSALKAAANDYRRSTS